MHRPRHATVGTPTQVSGGPREAGCGCWITNGTRHENSSGHPPMARRWSRPRHAWDGRGRWPSTRQCSTKSRRRAVTTVWTGEEPYAMALLRNTRGTGSPRGLCTTLRPRLKTACHLRGAACGRRWDAPGPVTSDRRCGAMTTFLFVTAAVALLAELRGLVAGHLPRTPGPPQGPRAAVPAREQGTTGHEHALAPAHHGIAP